MDIQPLVSSIITTTKTTITKMTTARRRFLSTIQRSAPSLYPCSLHRTFCSSRSNSREPKQDGDDSNGMSLCI
uniref:Uncharacterized protein n=1 Tax=Rhizophora mucronata TaxID=61149 RepID=A0A2P2JAZ5_RHIMU